MAKKTAGVWGIDLGFCALKALRLEKGPDGITATAFDYIEHPKILTQPDADPDQLTREALEQFLSRNNITGDTIVISVPGQSGLARFVKLPPVEERKIAEIVKFEAKQQIPFPLDEVVWDFQKIGKPIISDGLAMDSEIGLFAMKKDMVHRYVQHFRDVLVECHVVQMAPLALVNYVAYDLLRKNPPGAPGTEDEEPSTDKNCVVALDIGTDNSNLVITDGEKVIWQRAVPLGGNHFTRALTKDAAKLTFAKAEHVKRNAVKSPDLRKILGSLKPVLNDFVGEVQRSLGYFTNTHRDANIQYLVGLGGGFRLPGLQKFLQEKLQLEVKKVSRFDRLKGEEVLSSPQFTENLLSFAVPYGLAIQGLKQARLQTNLLPQEVRMERLVRGKKPWAAAAAAALLVAIAGLTYGENQQKQAVDNPEIKAAQKDAEMWKQKRKQKEDEVDNLKKDLASKTEESRRITTGLDERFNWHLLMQYINCTIPQANGNKLVDISSQRVPVFANYYTENAKKAAELQERKRFPDTKAKNKDPGLSPKDEEFIKKHLVQISIEGVNALYTEDVPGYFQRASQGKELLRGMTQEEKDIVAALSKGVPLNEEQKKKVPESAWVIEIRGYTYLDSAAKFLEESLMENLRYPEMVNPDLLPARRARTMAARNRPAAAARPGPEEKMFEDSVLNRTSFMFLYVAKAVENPPPGQFVHIRSSSLAGLIGVQKEGARGGGGRRGPGRKGAEPPPEPDPAADAGPKKKDRSGWRPIGEQAGLMYAGGGAFDGGGRFGGRDGGVQPMPIPGPNDKNKGATPPVAKQPRYEFVILFLWKEPIHTMAASADAAKKDKE
jgi:type IV pilus assembly protein PilM